jgi:hypothetical protein
MAVVRDNQWESILFMPLDKLVIYFLLVIISPAVMPILGQTRSCLPVLAAEWGH